MIDEVSRSPSYRKQPAIALLLIAGVLCAAWWAVEPRLLAQSVGLPAPRLLTTTPMGSKAGSQIEITITKAGYKLVRAPKIPNKLGAVVLDGFVLDPVTP